MSMSKFEIASLAVKIVALYVIVNAVISTAISLTPYVEQYIFAASQGTNPQTFIPAQIAREVIVLVVPLAVAFVLWKYADWLAARMVKETKVEKTKHSLTSLEIQSLVVSVVGLFVTISATPQFVLFFLALSLPALPEANFSSILIQLVNPLVYVIIGGILLFNASRIAAYLQSKQK